MLSTAHNWVCTYHLGSLISIPCCSVPPVGMLTRQFSTSAQILKAFAMGPKVPATSGMPVLAYHHLAFSITLFSCSSSLIESNDFSEVPSWKGS